MHRWRPDHDTSTNLQKGSADSRTPKSRRNTNPALPDGRETEVLADWATKKPETRLQARWINGGLTDLRLIGSDQCAGLHLNWAVLHDHVKQRKANTKEAPPLITIDQQPARLRDGPYC